MGQQWSLLRGCIDARSSGDLELRQWVRNPTNGLNFLSARKKAFERGARGTEGEQQLVRWMDQDENGLRYHRCWAEWGSFGGGYWTCGDFDVEVLGSAIQMMHRLVHRTVLQLEDPDEETRLLAGMYFGSCDDRRIGRVHRRFAKLLRAIRRGGARGRGIIFLRARNADAESGRTYGFVPKSETTARQVFGGLTESFDVIALTPSWDRRSEDGLSPDYCRHVLARAHTILHELTHVRLQTDDLPTQWGREAYGREACHQLTVSYLESGGAYDPMDNADSWAYFALDLYLMQVKRVALERLDEAGDMQLLERVRPPERTAFDHEEGVAFVNPLLGGRQRTAFDGGGTGGSNPLWGGGNQ